MSEWFADGLARLVSVKIHSHGCRTNAGPPDQNIDNEHFTYYFPDAFTKDRDLVLLACHRRQVSPILQPSRRKLLIRLGKSLILESGKATTRVKHSITAAFEGTGPPVPHPHAGIQRKQCCSIETRGRVRFVPNKQEVVKFLPSLPEWTRT